MSSSGSDLTKKECDAFVAIKEFVVSLNHYFGQKNTKLALYHRLIETANLKGGPKDIERVRKVVDSFDQFCNKYSDQIVQRNYDSLPKGSRICYDGKENIAIDIKHLISNADPSTRQSISDHLLTIAALLGDQQTLSSIDEKLEKELAEEEAKDTRTRSEILSGLDQDTEEGKFIFNVISKTQDSFSGAPPNDPMAAAIMIMSSGVFQDMTSNLTTGVQSGKLDIRKLFSLMQDTLNSVMPQNQSSPIPKGPQIVEAEVRTADDRLGRIEDHRLEPAQDHPLTITEGDDDTKVEDIVDNVD